MGQVNVNTPGDSGGGSAAAIVLVVVVLIVLVLLLLYLTGFFNPKASSEIFGLLGV